MIPSPGRTTLERSTIEADYDRRADAGPDAAQRAIAQRFLRQAGAGGAAAQGARPDEMGADQRQQPADAHPLPALEGVARKAASHAQRDQPREDDAGAA